MKKSYTVLTPVEHDNKAYEPAATISIEDEQAAPLLAVKAIEPAPEEAKPAKK